MFKFCWSAPYAFVYLPTSIPALKRRSTITTVISSPVPHWFIMQYCMLDVAYESLTELRCTRTSVIESMSDQRNHHLFTPRKGYHSFGHSRVQHLPMFCAAVITPCRQEQSWVTTARTKNYIPTIQHQWIMNQIIFDLGWI